MNLKFIILIFGFKVMDCLRTQKCSRRSFVLIFALLGNLSYLNSFKTRAMLEEIGNLPANLLFQSLLETYLVSILVLMDYLFGRLVQLRAMVAIGSFNPCFDGLPFWTL